MGSGYLTGMNLPDILARIDERLEILALSQDKASSLAKKPDSIRNMRRALEEGRPMDVKIGTLNALAPVLETTAVWLFAGPGSGLANAEQPAGAASDIVTESPKRRFIRPLYGGVVEAGSFREVNDFEDPDRIIPDAEEDPRFPGVPIISFDVAGDSMNALQPTPILPGQRVIGIDFEGLGNRVPLRDGMVVIVEQSLNGGHLRERSVKQLEMHRDRTEFCPRSTNPKHKPIVVPFDTVDQGDEDGREVKVLAIVRQVISDLPTW